MSGWWLAYPLLGCFAGFVAGLFGVGGGLTLVPVLSMLFAAQQFPDRHLMHLALGTSMATIVFTSVASMRAHHRHDAVRWDVVRSMAPGLLAGTLSGSLVAGAVPTRPLAIAFTVITYYASLQMLLDFKPKASRQLPGPPVLFGVGALIGVVSSLVAAGGGFLSIPFMLWCNVRLHHAVGTSSALGLPIAAAGAIGYLAAGWHADGLPGPSAGFVYIPALVGIVVATMLVAPMGARFAHRLPVNKLKRAFGVFLALLATKMLMGLIG